MEANHPSRACSSFLSLSVATVLLITETAPFAPGIPLFLLAPVCTTIFMVSNVGNNAGEVEKVTS